MRLWAKHRLQRDEALFTTMASVSQNGLTLTPILKDNTGQSVILARWLRWSMAPDVTPTTMNWQMCFRILVSANPKGAARGPMPGTLSMRMAPPDVSPAMPLHRMPGEAGPAMQLHKSGGNLGSAFSPWGVSPRGSGPAGVPPMSPGVMARTPRGPIR